jgi:hypothetical protein
VTWHLALFAVWAAGAIPVAFFVAIKLTICHEDHLHVSAGFVARSLLLVTCWPVFLLQHATTAREKAT